MPDRLDQRNLLAAEHKDIAGERIPAEQAPPVLALDETEIRLLDQLVKDKIRSRRKTLGRYLAKIAQLGGYLARATDPPPGNIVMWRGLSRLTDIKLGMQIVGN